MGHLIAVKPAERRVEGGRAEIIETGIGGGRRPLARGEKGGGGGSPLKYKGRGFGGRLSRKTKKGGEDG